MGSYDKKYDDFIAWVKSEMNILGLTHNDVARHGCARSLVTRTLGKHNNPGEKFFLAVAGALKVSLDEVYGRAGLFEDFQAGLDAVEPITKELADLPPEDQQAARDFIAFLRSKKKDDDDDDTARVEKAKRLTKKQLDTVIETAHVISTVRRQRTPKKTQPDNQLYPAGHQSLSP